MFASVFPLNEACPGFILKTVTIEEHFVPRFVAMDLSCCFAKAHGRSITIIFKFNTFV